MARPSARTPSTSQFSGGRLLWEPERGVSGRPAAQSRLYQPARSIIPTQDSIGEFKVQYNNLGPEWGQVFSGGVINLSTQSGSNE